MAKSEMIIFNDIKFRRYPDSKKRAHQVYYWPSGNHRKRGIGALHQEIWRAYHGEIPENHVIHHIDGNPLNNHISNLEAMSSSEHSSLHSSDPVHLERQRKHINRIRPLAKKWHSSPEGIEWHKKHVYKSMWKDRNPISYVCKQCGKDFTSRKKSGVKFCSGNCKSKWRRANGLDAAQKQCIICERVFVTIDKKVKHCSRRCAGITSSRKRLGFGTSDRRGGSESGC